MPISKYDIGAVPDPGEIKSAVGGGQLNEQEQYNFAWLDRIKEKREAEKREARRQKEEEKKKGKTPAVQEDIFKSGKGYVTKPKFEKELIKTHVSLRKNESGIFALKESPQKQHQVFGKYFPDAAKRSMYKREDITKRIKVLKKEKEKLTNKPSVPYKEIKNVKKQIEALERFKFKS